MRFCILLLYLASLFIEGALSSSAVGYEVCIAYLIYKLECTMPGGSPANTNMLAEIPNPGHKKPYRTRPKPGSGPNGMLTFDEFAPEIERAGAAMNPRTKYITGTEGGRNGIDIDIHKISPHLHDKWGFLSIVPTRLNDAAAKLSAASKDGNISGVQMAQVLGDAVQECRGKGIKDDHPDLVKMRDAIHAAGIQRRLDNSKAVISWMQSKGWTVDTRKVDLPSGLGDFEEFDEAKTLAKSGGATEENLKKMQGHIQEMRTSNSLGRADWDQIRSHYAMIQEWDTIHKKIQPGKPADC
jgi:hypothetical protein